MARSPIWASRPKTRGLVLDAIRAARTISRVELAAATGLTGATISEVVRELLGDGLVVEVGRGAPTGGKPRTLVQLNPSARYGVGVLLERNTCVIVVVDLAGTAGGPDFVPGRGVDVTGAGAAAGGVTGGRPADDGGRRPRDGARGRPGQLRSAGPARGCAADAAAHRGVVRLPRRAAARGESRPARAARQRRRGGRHRRVLDGCGGPAQHLWLHLHGHRDRRRRGGRR